jgi:hypothetical protein
MIDVFTCAEIGRDQAGIVRDWRATRMWLPALP